MKLDTLENECRSLQTIRARWQSVGWPLDRIDGENGIIECLYTLRNFTLYEALTTKAENGQTVEQLIEDLEDFYRTALQAWDEFRTVFEHEQTQRHLSRWPDGTYPASIRQAARYHFWELVTTTRFNVRDIKTAAELIAVDFEPLPPLEKKHIVSLAMMVCVQDAIEALEQIEATGNSENDQANLNEAWEAQEHAAFWLTHFETLNVASRELNHAVKKAWTESERRFKAEKSKQARQAAKQLRTPLTPPMVASYIKAHPDKQQKALVLELAEIHKVSVRTVSTRLKEAKTLNLMQ
jgi:uncharacterized protein YeaO (DUF488 family)